MYWATQASQHSKFGMMIKGSIVINPAMDHNSVLKNPNVTVNGARPSAFLTSMIRLNIIKGELSITTDATLPSSPVMNLAEDDFPDMIKKMLTMRCDALITAKKRDVMTLLEYVVDCRGRPERSSRRATVKKTRLQYVDTALPNVLEAKMGIDDT